jgi:hypothetical protein
MQLIEADGVKDFVMRILIRIGIFVLALLLGLQAVTLANAFFEQFSLPLEIEVVGSDEKLARAELPKGIRISYNGAFPRVKDHPPFLRFLIYNGSPNQLTCIGHSGICASPEIRLRDLDASAWVCMNGSSHYTIKPGESAELTVSVEDFNLLPGKTDEVVIGYKFEHPDGRSDQYFAEPIVLPAEFRKGVIKYLKEVRDLEAGIY